MSGPNCPWCSSPTRVRFWFSQLAECGTCGAIQIPAFLAGGWLTEEEQVVRWRRPQEDYPVFSPFNPDPPEPPRFNWD
jgi:hypothetical protein